MMAGGSNRHTPERGQRHAVAAAGLLGVSLCVLCAAPRADAASLEIYGRLPHIEEVALSPDGSRLAFVKTEGETRTVTVFSVADHKLLRGLHTGEQKLRSIRWADNDRLMIVTSRTGVPIGWWGGDSEWFQMQVYDVRNGDLLLLPQGDGFNGVTVMNALFGPVVVRRLQGHTVLFIRGLKLSSQMTLALVRADLELKTCRVVRLEQRDNFDWLVDDSGEVAATETYDGKKRHWSILIHRDGHAREILSGHEDIEIPRLLGWGPTADTLLLERLEDGDPVWRLVSLKDGGIGPSMTERKSLEAPIENRATNRMIGGVHIGDSPEYVFFDPIARYAWDMVLETFPGEHVRLYSHSDDFRKFLVRVEGAPDGYRFELVDLDAHRATPLGDVYEGVGQVYEVRRINYVAADGTEIPAYLTLPRGRAPSNLPLIVLPHGGPATRDTADFDWWSQAYADQGYAVLQPNYRGSSLGWKYLSSGFGEWGRKMQTDLSDGVRYLAKEGIADPKRVCIIGGSYGGYAALAGVSLDPGVYRCAVSVAGIGDLGLMFRWIRERAVFANGMTERYWDRFMGVSGPDDPRVDAISPIKHLGAINVPVLLIHGRDDTVVAYDQSQVMYDALRKANKDVQLVTLKHEDHWLSRSETRLQMLQASVAFLRANNPPD